VRSSHVTRRRGCMRYSATSQKVAVSIPGDIFGNIHWYNNFGPTVALGVDSVSNRNEYQKYLLGCTGGRCKGLTSLPYFCADFLEIWKPLSPGTLRVCPGQYRVCFTFSSSSLWTQTAYTIQWRSLESQSLLFLGTTCNTKMHLNSTDKLQRFSMLKPRCI
jgi:hypothetical protein